MSRSDLSISCKIFKIETPNRWAETGAGDEGGK